jgi:hypothetical protein
MLLLRDGAGWLLPRIGFSSKHCYILANYLLRAPNSTSHGRETSLGTLFPSELLSYDLELTFAGQPWRPYGCGLAALPRSATLLTLPSNLIVFSWSSTRSATGNTVDADCSAQRYLGSQLI